MMHPQVGVDPAKILQVDPQVRRGATTHQRSQGQASPEPENTVDPRIIIRGDFGDTAKTPVPSSIRADFVRFVEQPRQQSALS